MKPRSMPKASSSTLAIGTTELVVQDALEMMSWLAGSYLESLTPITMVTSSPLAGADRLAVHADRGFVEAHLAVEYTEGGVVLQQVREGAVVGQVVDGHDLDVALAAAGSVACGAVEVAADAAEAVDAYSDGHAPSCCWRYSGLRGSGPRRRDRRRSRPLFRTAPRVVTRLSPPPPTGVSRRTTRCSRRPRAAPRAGAGEPGPRPWSAV